MYLNRKWMSVCLALFLTGCSTGFLGLAPMGDRQEYVHARDLYNSGEYEQAIRELTDYIYKTKNVKRREARAYRLLGLSYEHIGRLDKALELYLEALEFHPQNVPLLSEAARLYRQTGLTNRSIELYERVFKEEPNNIDALAGQAENYLTMGFYSKARTYYDRFFELNPTAAARYRAAYAYTFLQQRNFRQAFIHITMALAEENTNPDFWLLSAKARRGLHEYQAALDDLHTALLLAPQREDLLGHQALWLYDVGEYAESLRTAAVLATVNPRNQLVPLVRGLVTAKQHKKQLSRNYLKQAVALDETSFIGKTAAKLLEQP